MEENEKDAVASDEALVAAVEQYEGYQVMGIE